MRTEFSAHSFLYEIPECINVALSYRVAAYAALSLNYHATDLVLGGGSDSDYLGFHEVYSQFTFMEKCAFDIALQVITIERGIAIPLEAQAGVVTDFVLCLRESSEGRIYYPEGVGSSELIDILRELAEPENQPVIDVHEPSDGEPSDRAIPSTAVPRRRSGWLIAGSAVAALGVVAAAGCGGLWWGRHDRPPLIDAGPARSGVPLGTNVSIRMLATYQDSDGQPRTVEAVSGIAPETPAILTFPADPSEAVLRLQLHLALTERTDEPDPDLQIAFGDNPLTPVGNTYRTDPEHPDGDQVGALTINPSDTHLELGDGDTIYQFDVTLGDPSNYWCGYNTKPMVIYATNGTDPMVVASLPVVVFKDCVSTAH